MNTPSHCERMSRVDTTWLRMDADGSVKVIVGLFVVQPGITHEALLQRLGERLLKYPRFRQRVEHDAMGALWVDEGEAFKLHRHVVLEALGPRPSRAALRQRVGELATQALDAQHPLWCFHLVPRYGRGSALICRVHHCMADGMALIQVLLGLADGGVDPPQAEHPPLDDPDWLAESLLRPLADMALRAAARMAEGRTEPQAAADTKATPSTARLLADAAALAMMPDDTPTRLKGKPSGRKCAAWCEPLALEEVKAVAHALGASLNDVLLACVAGALGEHLRDQGEAVEGAQLRAMVPVNLRPPGEAWKLGNHFGLAPLLLPVGMRNPVARVAAVHARMAQLKHSQQPHLSHALMGMASLLAKPVQDSLLRLFTRKATAVMTNVPGPRQALQLCGSRIEQLMFWVPTSGDIGVGVSVLSYAGGVQMGLITDARLCPNPQALARRFVVQFEQLLLLTLMLPWVGEPNLRD